MAATAALSAATVADLVPVGDDRFAAFTAGLALTTGLSALLAGVLRLGFLAHFISQPVLKGFIVGLALTITVGQLRKLLGSPEGDGNFFEQAWQVVTHLGDTKGPDAARRDRVARRDRGAQTLGTRHPRLARRRRARHRRRQV